MKSTYAVRDYDDYFYKIQGYLSTTDILSDYKDRMLCLGLNTLELKLEANDFLKELGVKEIKGEYRSETDSFLIKSLNIGTSYVTKSVCTGCSYFIVEQDSEVCLFDVQRILEIQNLQLKTELKNIQTYGNRNLLVVFNELPYSSSFVLNIRKIQGLELDNFTILLRVTDILGFFNTQVNTCTKIITNMNQIKSMNYLLIIETGEIVESDGLNSLFNFLCFLDRYLEFTLYVEVAIYIDILKDWGVEFTHIKIVGK